MHRKNDGRYRPRIVLKGYGQQKGVDYLESYAPTASITIFRLLVGVAAANGLKPRTFDVGNAFANSDILEELYMEIPDGYVDVVRGGSWPEDIQKGLASGKKRVLRLNKTLYGAKQAARNWYLDVKKLFESMGFKSSAYDQGLFYYRRGDEYVLTCVWVDDFLWVETSKEFGENLLNQLFRKYKVKETFGKILGMEVTMVGEEIWLNQKDYIDGKTGEFGLNDGITVETPMIVRIDWKRIESGLKVDRPYQKLIGSLMHAMVYTRPDISFSVGVLSRFSLKFNDEHYELARRVLRYLRTTREEGLCFTRGKVELSGYVDAAYANCDETARSTTGFVILLNGTAIMWRSKRQTMVTMSTAESEVVAASEAAREIMWLRKILEELGFEQEKATKLNEDNQACVVIATKPEGKNRTRHLDTKYHYVVECVERGQIEIKGCSTSEMAADMLTKALDKMLVRKFKERMNLKRNTTSVGVLEDSRSGTRDGVRTFWK